MTFDFFKTSLETSAPHKIGLYCLSLVYSKTVLLFCRCITTQMMNEKGKTLFSFSSNPTLVPAGENSSGTPWTKLGDPSNSRIQSGGRLESGCHLGGKSEPYYFSSVSISLSWVLLLNNCFSHRSISSILHSQRVHWLMFLLGPSTRESWAWGKCWESVSLFSCLESLVVGCEPRVWSGGWFV